MIDRWRDLGRANLPVVHFLADTALWVVGVPFAVWLRYDFDIGRIGGGTGAAIMAAVGITMTGMFRGDDGVPRGSTRHNRPGSPPRTRTPRHRRGCR